MEKLRVHYDREGNTLSVWFDDPKKEYVCEESDDVVLVKDRRGRVIGFERLNFLSAKQAQRRRRHSCGSTDGLTGKSCSTRLETISTVTPCNSSCPQSQYRD